MARDWRDDRIAELEAIVADRDAALVARDARIAALEAQVSALLARVSALEERLRQSSQNSSKPPSSDGPAKPSKRQRKKSGRKRGGQPGHARHERPVVPPEKVSERIVLKPSHCEKCETRVSGDDPEPVRHQVFELPKVEPIVKEYVRHTRTCGRCHHVTRAPLPEGVPTRIFGSSVTATIALLMGTYRQSKRQVAEMLLDLYDLPISVGAVIDCQREASAAIAAPVEEARVAAQSAPVKHADETGWREAGKRAWLWTLVTSSVTVFLIARGRGEDVARRLLGVVAGVLVTDRHGAYNFWNAPLRQFCWAHLIRDFTAIKERGGSAGVTGSLLLEEAERMFAWWYRVRDGTLSRSSFKIYMRSLQARVEALLTQGAHDSNLKTARTCAKLLKAKASLWTFVRNEGVEPTNNVAERTVRHGVLCRKLSSGTQSEHGSRFIERILTVHATLRQQGRRVLPFLTEACEARLRRAAPPSLLSHTPKKQNLRLAA